MIYFPFIIPSINQVYNFNLYKLVTDSCGCNPNNGFISTNFEFNCAIYLNDKFLVLVWINGALLVTYLIAKYTNATGGANLVRTEPDSSNSCRQGKYEYLCE